mmetsp:Transcript_14441/g.50777  ORF Transcript_14441/g.50777 Transcript_14441/m.50777 type:complete len:464 (+) Transcript_14441:135-1526(+)
MASRRAPDALAGAAALAAGGPADVVWAVFAVSVPILVAIDNLCLTERYRGEVSISAASWQCAFWIAMGLSFNAFIWCTLGTQEGISWLSGYVLEYMLSIDNLFCFHLIFTSYRTPKDQTPRALLYGIGVAVLLRFLLFALGASLFNFTFVVHWVFGGILLWSGFKVMTIDEEGDTDHKRNWAVQQLSKVFPVEECYAPQAAFFIDTPSSAASSGSGAAGGGTITDFDEAPYLTVRRDAARDLEVRRDAARDLEATLPSSDGGSGAGQIGPLDADGASLLRAAGSAASTVSCCSSAGGGAEDKGLVRGGRRKATLLLLVVVTLGAVDLVFALDSVTAKVAMVSQFDDRVDLALNFTSSAFTMLTLRSLYFLLASLVHIFRLMKYGVGLILILIGLRLILQSYVRVSEALFCFVMLFVFAVSLLASVVLPSPAGKDAAALPHAGACSLGATSFGPGAVELSSLDS